MTPRKPRPTASGPPPISGADVARKQVGLTFPTMVGNVVWWQEARPAEGGRLAVVCRGPGGDRRDLLPMPAGK